MRDFKFQKISLITLSVLSVVLLNSCKPEPNTPPKAVFTISPSFGTVDTTFTFDASAVNDLEDAAADLQVRWDWESDSIFDTDFSVTKIARHKFTAGGTIYISVEVRDTKGSTARYTDFVKVQWNNRPPKAALTVTPKTGFLQDIFTMDASGCSDAEDKKADLQVRFDFEGDGTWDTEYSKVKTATHQYSAPGSYTVAVMVKDSEEATDTETYVLNVGATNTAPETPKDPSPADLATKASTLGILTWTCIDPDKDSLKYDVYFGLDANPPKVATDKSGSYYECLPLEYSTRYYWKVVVRDPYGHEVTSPVWSFTTNASVYPVSSFTDTRDGQVYKSVKINERIWMAQNLNVGTMINPSQGQPNDGNQTDNGKAEKYCYKNELANCAIYGGLYQWNEAMGYDTTAGSAGLCPEGWHMPTDTEWHDLILFLDPVDAEAQAGTQLALGGLSGFQALFSGYIIFAERKYYDLGSAGYFWSSTINPNPVLSHLALIRSIYRGRPAFQQDTSQKLNGLPVRCVKNY